MSEDTHEIRPDVECDAFQKALAYIQERADATGNKKMIAAAEAIEAAEKCAMADIAYMAGLRADLEEAETKNASMFENLREARKENDDLKAQVRNFEDAKKVEADAIVAMRIAQTEAATMRECMDKVFPTPAGVVMHSMDPETFGV